jgi:raffinose/stachyose/melibiose transport system substrate-binding protein
MRLSRRQLVAAVPAAALAAVRPARAQDGRTVITYWYGAANAAGQAALQHDLVEAFNASQSQWRLVMEVKGGAINNLLRVALLAGNGPDIVQTNGPSYLTPIATAGQVLALDDLAQKYGWKDAFLPALLNTDVFGGKLYALPRDYESMHLFYNKAMFAENGWKLPTNRAEMEAVAEAALAKGIVPFGNGNADWKGVNEWLLTVFINNVAGPDTVRRALTGELPWTAAPFVEAIDLSKSWYQKGYFGKNYFSLAGEQAFMQAVNGKAAMVMSGSWAFGYIGAGMNKPDTVMDVVPVPTLGSAFTGGLYQLGCGATMSIARNSPNVEGVVAMFNFIQTEGFYQAMNRDWPGKWTIPVKNLSPAMLKGIGYPLFEKAIADMHDAFESGKYGFTTWTFWPGATETYLIDGIEQVWLNRATTADYLTKMNSMFQQEMKEGKVPPIPPRTA